MARIWRKPGVLMTAYMVLYAVASVWAATRVPAIESQPPDLGGALIGVFFAWRVTRGSAFSRGLIVVFTAVLLVDLLNSRDLKSGGLVSLGLLAICLAQIALLVSTPVYVRTRRDWAERTPSTARMWPTPRWWIAAVALAAGLLITLAFLGSEDFRTVPCGQPPSAAPERCVTLVQGFPVHFLSTSPSSDLAAPVIDNLAAAEDMAVWTMLSFAACYLIWLPRQRPAETATAPIAAPI